ncbi:ATP-binding protein [Spirulina sp. CS-785/01]|uniref:ATP-binding protein n=1 Tax=Spirulina sp. CS-785/01 TaxID=3021716 RepID=UPI002330BFC1|nr:ATP-binding protein [Spirulina sp. CS-785/01]MDB9313810.1 ATP-binding protein [Spirulina sp. CS-785/01]
MSGTSSNSNIQSPETRLTKESLKKEGRENLTLVLPLNQRQPETSTMGDFVYSTYPVHTLHLNSTLAELTLYRASLDINSQGETASRLFEENSSLPGLILYQNKNYVGMISRPRFFEKMSRPYSLELFSKRSLSHFYDYHGTEVLQLSQNTTIVAAVQESLKRPIERAYEPIVVAIDNEDYAILSVHELLFAHSQIHLLATQALKESEEQLKEQACHLAETIQKLKKAQTRLIQAEKMSALGQLVAGIAHEINNPISFVYGNIKHAQAYFDDLLKLLNLYQKHHPHCHLEIQDFIESIDLEFLVEDTPKAINSIEIGATRIQEIVQSLRLFSRLDEATLKEVDLHEGIESTLLILQSRLNAQSQRPAIHIQKDYSKLPKVECYAGQLNQVFMNILSNAIDALDGVTEDNPTPEICIRTEQTPSGNIGITIADNGPGIPDNVQEHLFTPFFTTKPIGKGTGLGLSVSYAVIVERHKGELSCRSKVGQGTEFYIEIAPRLKT